MLFRLLLFQNVNVVLLNFLYFLLLRFPVLVLLYLLVLHISCYNVHKLYLLPLFEFSSVFHNLLLQMLVLLLPLQLLLFQFLCQQLYLFLCDVQEPCLLLYPFVQILRLLSLLLVLQMLLFLQFLIYLVLFVIIPHFLLFLLLLLRFHFERFRFVLAFVPDVLLLFVIDLILDFQFLQF